MVATLCMFLKGTSGHPREKQIGREVDIDIDSRSCEINPERRNSPCPIRTFVLAYVGVGLSNTRKATSLRRGALAITFFRSNSEVTRSSLF